MKFALMSLSLRRVAPRLGLLPDFAPALRIRIEIRPLRGGRGWAGGAGAVIPSRQRWGGREI